MSSERKVSVGPPPLRSATVELTTDATDEDDTAAHELGGMNLGLDAIESEDADASPPAPAPPAAAKRPKSTATRTRTGKASRRKPDQTERQTSTTGMTKTTVLLPSELWEFARAWTAESSRSNADLVLTAQHRHLATLEGTYGKATDGWREAAGLRPLAVLESKAKAKNTRRQQFGLYARASAVDDIAGHATRLGLSISQYVSELLTLELRDGQ